MSERLSALVDAADQAVRQLEQALSEGQAEPLLPLAQELTRILRSLKAIEVSEWHSPAARTAFLRQLRGDVQAQVRALNRAQTSVQRELAILLPDAVPGGAYGEQGFQPHSATRGSLVA